MTYCFTGYPLAGKTRLADAVARKTGVKRFSTGDLARALGMGVEESISTHDLSMEHDCEITAAALQAAADCDVLDGFPRSVGQVEALRSQGTVFKVVFVVENPLLIHDRIVERASREGRPEDTPEVVVGRLRASMAFKRELEDMLLVGEMLTFQSSEGEEALFEELGL